MQGDRRVELYMRPVAEAVQKHFGIGHPAGVEIYNRAYEAVEKALNNWLPPHILETQNKALDHWKRKESDND